jgi:hypothetical protein
MSLFDPVASESKLGESFRRVRDEKGFAPARQMLDEVFAAMGDRDGNFVEQFQTTGFDARTWELYLYAAFAEAGYSLDQSHEVPDFILDSGEHSWTVEATTSSRRPGEGQLQLANTDNLLDFLANELPIRLGSPLYSKLQKDYPDLPHVAGKPFVLALECFASQDAFFFSESTVTSYLLGRDTVAETDADGTIRLRTVPIDEHQVGAKRIPSGFFQQAETDLVSAVIYSNSGTISKFNRIGFQEGRGSEGLWMARQGLRAVPDPSVYEPEYFWYEVGDVPEQWGQGLVVIHNPNAKHPLSRDALPGAVHYQLEDDQISTIDRTGLHIFMSRTVIVAGVEDRNDHRLDKLKATLTKGFAE